MRVVAFLSSRAFALFLLSVSVAVLILRVKRPELYSPLFLLIPASLFLSLVVCTARRLRGGRKDVRFLGSILFHGGLMIWVATLFASPLVRFSARLFLVEGMVIGMEDREAVEIYERPFLGGAPPLFSFLLRGYRERYEEGMYPVEYTAMLSVGYMDGDRYRTEEKRIRINEPVDLGGYRFLFESSGWAPLFRLRRDGEVLFERYIFLVSITEEEDSFKIDSAGLEVFTRFFPDLFMEDGKVGTRSRVVRNPAFGIKIAREEAPFVDIYRGVLRPGEVAEVDGMRLEFVDLRPFVVLLMVRDPLYPVVFAGWGLGVVGLLFRYGPWRRV